MDVDKKIEFFEKNVLDEMSANHIAIGQSYLEKAINAQHGGFPSRLLDVSYNSLIALFFAITPFYNKKIDDTDKEDGFVYVFNIFFYSFVFSHTFFHSTKYLLTFYSFFFLT